MKTIFDNFDSTTGWTASGATICALNTVKEKVAGDLLSSLVFKFSNKNDYVKKTYSVPISTVGYEELTLWVWSRNKRSNEYRTKDDFSYKISFGTSKEFYLPCYNTFEPIVIAVSKIGSTLDEIKITALTDDEDYLIISYGAMSIDEFPLDVIIGLKEKLDNKITEVLTTSYLVGTISGTAGDTSITFLTDVPWLDRYVTVKITDGVHTEYHSISERDGKTFSFYGTRSGKSLLYTYTSASVYVYFPVVYGRRQIEIEVPSITLWSMEPERITLANQQDEVIDTFSLDDTIGVRKEGHFLKYSVLVDCEARNDELLAALMNIVNKVVGRRHIYCNGRLVEIDFSRPATEIEPTDTFDIVPKVQYVVDIIVQEETDSRVFAPVTKEATISVDFL